MLTDDDVEDGHVAHDGGDDHGGEGQVPEVEEAGPHLLLQVPGARRGSLQDVRVVVGCQGKQRITITFRVGVIYVHREWVIGYGGQYSLETIKHQICFSRIGKSFPKSTVKVKQYEFFFVLTIFLKILAFCSSPVGTLKLAE